MPKKNSWLDLQWYLFSKWYTLPSNVQSLFLPSFLPSFTHCHSLSLTHTQFPHCHSQRFFMAKLAKMNKQPIEVMKVPWPLQRLSFRSNTHTVKQLIDSQCVINETASASRTSVSVFLFLFHTQKTIRLVGTKTDWSDTAIITIPLRAKMLWFKKRHPRKDVYFGVRSRRTITDSWLINDSFWEVRLKERSSIFSNLLW